MTYYHPANHPKIENFKDYRNNASTDAVFEFDIKDVVVKDINEQVEPLNIGTIHFVLYNSRGDLSFSITNEESSVRIEHIKPDGSLHSATIYVLPQFTNLINDKSEEVVNRLHFGNHHDGITHLYLAEDWEGLIEAIIMSLELIDSTHINYKLLDHFRDRTRLVKYRFNAGTRSWKPMGAKEKSDQQAYQQAYIQLNATTWKFLVDNPPNPFDSAFKDEEEK